MPMNPRVLSTLSLLSLTLGAPAALAQDSEDRPIQGSGFAFGVRTGLGLPLGLLEGGDGHEDRKLRDVVDGIIPVQLDAGFFLGSSFYVGASFQYARTLLDGGCPEGTECSASDLRFGVNASFHFPVSGRMSPWLGVGAGYEILKPRGLAYKGVEFLNGQVGADFNLSGPVWAGPYAMFTAGRFTNVNEDRPHYWLIGGVRLLFRH